MKKILAFEQEPIGYAVHKELSSTHEIIDFWSAVLEKQNPEFKERQTITWSMLQDFLKAHAFDFVVINWISNHFAPRIGDTANFVTAIKKHQPKTKIIFLSSVEEEKGKVLDSGGDVFIRKTSNPDCIPFILDELR